MLPLQALIAALIAVLSIVGRFVPMGWPFALLIFLHVAAVLSQFWLANRAVKTAKASRVERTVEVNNILAPLASSLSQVPSSKGGSPRQRAVVAFLIDATSACVGLTPAENCRATFYWVEGGPGHQVFVPWQTTGRGDPPHSNFYEDDAREGAEVWRVARLGEVRYVRDTEATEIPFFDRTRTRRYRTFITVPVLCAHEPVGLLTLNAPEPDDLTSEDVDSIRLIADLIATAIGTVGGKCPSRG